MIKRTMLAKCGFKQEGNHICCVNFFLFLVGVTNGAIVIHTQRLKSDPGGNLLS